MNIDIIANALKNTVLHPLVLLGYVGFRAQQVDFHWPVRDGLLTTAYVFLTIRFGRWFSNRWRNGGLMAPKRLNKTTWPDEIALITGGAQGIGKATAEQLAARGCKVAAIDIVDFKPSHANIRAYKVDISDYEALSTLRDRIRSDFGGDVTMVANIAGINNKSLILDLNARKVDAMVNVNLKSHFYTAMLFLPAMIKRKRGHFLSVSSTMGYVGICHQSDYVATKHALVGMQESLYYEMHKMYKTPKVRTSIAMIGHTKTALFEDFKVTHGVGRFLGPLLEPEYVASQIVDTLEAQETRILLTPFMNHLTPAIKALPSFVRDVIQWSAGGDGTYPTRPTAAQLG